MRKMSKKRESVLPGDTTAQYYGVPGKRRIEEESIYNILDRPERPRGRVKYVKHWVPPLETLKMHTPQRGFLKPSTDIVRKSDQKCQKTEKVKF